MLELLSRCGMKRPLSEAAISAGKHKTAFARKTYAIHIGLGQQGHELPGCKLPDPHAIVMTRDQMSSIVTESKRCRSRINFWIQPQLATFQAGSHVANTEHLTATIANRVIVRCKRNPGPNTDALF